MNDYNVGAGILNIITQSLYDNPIVVFREYVQNSVDAIFNSGEVKDRCIKILATEDNVYFLDNGSGIKRELFKEKMGSIGISDKKKTVNLGYKGIGRLSGVPYCNELIFVNIISYTKKEYQQYTIYNSKYENIRANNDDQILSFGELMDKISEYKEGDLDQTISSVLSKYSDCFKNKDTGFLVILKNISPVLKNTILGDEFKSDLEWLLPLDFQPELYNVDQRILFEELSTESYGVVCVKCCPIYYNDEQLFRPIKKDMLRKYVCKCDFKYAVGFHSFNSDKICIDKNNPFSGIRIYMDNMLLCDEKELLQNLENYGLLSHTINGQMQSVRGIGAMIYITDKINISANARRTFIEVADNDAIEFLNLLAEFVNIIYDARYAVSNYFSFKEKNSKDVQKLNELREDANQKLLRLANDKIEILNEPVESDFKELSIYDKKKIIKKHISSELSKYLKEYLKYLDQYELDNAFDNFIGWLAQRIDKV